MQRSARSNDSLQNQRLFDREFELELPEFLLCTTLLAKPLMILVIFDLFCEGFCFGKFKIQNSRKHFCSNLLSTHIIHLLGTKTSKIKRNHLNKRSRHRNSKTLSKDTVLIAYGNQDPYAWTVALNGHE